MTKNQLEALKRRNQQLQQDIADGSEIAMARVQRACTDIDSLVIDLDTMTRRAQDEQAQKQELRYELAEAKREISNLRRTVEPLRDKLSKARAILKQLDSACLTKQEKIDMRDIMKEI